MSKSKRPAGADASPAPKNKIKVYTDSSGRLRTGWLLALSLVSCALAALVVRGGLALCFKALFGAWGIDESTAARAPGWARWLYTWHGSLISLAAAAAAIGLSATLRRLWRISGNAPAFSAARTALCWLIGTAMALLIAALCLIPDSMRLEWPLSRPRFSGALPALWIIGLAGVLAEEVFTKRVLFDGLRLRWGSTWAVTVACAAFFLIGGGYAGNALCAANVALLGLVCCSLHARRGVWTSTAFRWGWSAANMFLLGFGGEDHGLYRLYHISEDWLTGGGSGLICGAWATLLLSVFLLWLERRKLFKALRRLKTN